jgi:acyl-CoA synthetase (AMP-forming)/AMP-acid ligase II
VPGELLIGGRQVMCGYWNLPDETSARLTLLDGVLCYRTGDICSYLADGSLFYIGRKDDEFNIGGYRVHPNEVRRVINSMSHVRGCEVVTLDTEYGERILAAAVLLDNSARMNGGGQLSLIKRRLVDELPRYMVPRYVAILERFPQLSSGKTDRKELSSTLEHMHRQTHEVMSS